jgi:hypothetical protein
MKGIVFGPKRKLSFYFGLFAMVIIMIFPVYADPVVKPTSGGTINVGFSTDPTHPNPGDQTLLKISFINKQTNSVQQHIDYKVSVMEGSNQIAGIQITHTAEGAVSIPVQFQDATTYQVIVEVDGILFQPIPPETANFSVIAGSPSSSQGTNQTTTNPTGTIKIPNWVRSTAKWWHDGQVGDLDFVKGIQYLIQQGIMQIPTQSQSTVAGQHQIPAWIKSNAGWWASGQISDNEFVKGIQWLITNGVIVV